MNGFEGTAPAIKARNIIKSYGGRRAVDGLSFSVERGEFFGILGPNGAGKTTTVKMVYGYAKPEGGDLEVLGREITAHRREIAAKIGVCQQENNLDTDLSIIENLITFASYFDIPRGAAKRRAEELLSFIGLGQRQKEEVNSLSGGMMRRLVLARALINDPDLLILDEPTTGLDPQSRHQLWDKLRELKARGMTILLTTHYMDEAERLCDRLVIMDEGKVLVEGKPRELIEKHAGKNVIEVTEPDESLRSYVKEKNLWADETPSRVIIYGREGDDDFLAIAHRCATAGCAMRMATLEDVFLRLTGRELRE